MFGVCGGRQFSVNGDDTQQVRILTCRPQRPDRHPAAVNNECVRRATGGAQRLKRQINQRVVVAFQKSKLKR